MPNAAFKLENSQCKNCKLKIEQHFLQEKKRHWSLSEIYTELSLEFETISIVPYGK